MVWVRIRVEAWPTTDVWCRYFGLAVDESLNEDFWRSQPDKVIGVWCEAFAWEGTFDLAPGDHTVELACSGYVPDYAWHAKIYVEGKLVAEGDVGRQREHHLVGRFTVSPAPSPSPTPSPIQVSLLLVVAVAALLGVVMGLALARRRS
jgi:hypothetical protein